MLEYEDIINESLTSNPQDYLKGPFSILLDSNEYAYGSDTYLSMNLLSEEEIEKNYNKFNKVALIKWQILSENFIIKHIKDLNLLLLARYQVLSEDFIRRYCMPLYLNPYMNDFFKSLIGNILTYQSLSDQFILDYYDTFIGLKNITILFKYQEMSKDTVRQILNMNKNSKTYVLICSLVCHYFELDTDMIEEYPELLRGDRNRYFIEAHQVLPKEFCDEKHIHIINGSVNSKDFWKQLICETGRFECNADSFYVYKIVRADGYAAYSSRYKFELGNSYYTFSDYSYNNYSFGFEGSTFKGMKYCKILIFKNSPKFKIIKLKVNYENVTYVGPFSFRYEDPVIRFNTCEVVEFEETDGELTEKLIKEIKNRQYNLVYTSNVELPDPCKNKHDRHHELKIHDMNCNMFKYE